MKLLCLTFGTSNSIIKEKEINMNKIKKQLRQLKDEKSFLETKIKWSVNDLQFYNHFNYFDERQKTINYLDITWIQYDELNKKIKEIKRSLKG
jgi:hypothetical protein